MDPIKEAIRSYILSEYLPGESPANLTDQTPLRTSGILDSMATLSLVSFVEKTFGVMLDAPGALTDPDSPEHRAWQAAEAVMDHLVLAAQFASSMADMEARIAEHAGDHFRYPEQADPLTAAKAWADR